MSVVLLPDAEQLLSGFLRDQDEIADIVAERVYTAIPKSAVFPLLLVRRITGAPRLSRPLHLDQAGLQLDAYGGSKKTAHTLIETARAVIAARIIGTHDFGVVTSYAFGPMSWLPDPAETPARARYVADVDLFIHP